MTHDELIANRAYRRAGDAEGSVDAATGEYVFRSEELGIEGRGATEDEAEAQFVEALRAHPSPAEQWARGHGK